MIYYIIVYLLIGLLSTGKITKILNTSDEYTGILTSLIIITTIFGWPIFWGMAFFTTDTD